MRTGALFLGIGLLLLCGPACSTIVTVGGGEQRYGWFFSGTRYNAAPFNPKGYVEYRDIRLFCAFFDFPCSLAFDTALSPLTLLLELVSPRPSGGEKPPSSEPPEKRE